MRSQNILFLLFILFACFSSSLLFAEDSKQLEQIDFANGLLQRGFYDMAKEEYQSFIRSFPDSEYLEEACFGLAESFFYLRMYEKALSNYQNFIKNYLDSKEVSAAQLRIAQSYFKLDRLDETLVALDLISSVTNDNVRQGLLHYKGLVFKKQGKEQKALAVFVKAGEIKTAKKFKALSFLEAAKISSSGQMFSEAYAYYQKAYESADTENLKRLILFEKGQMEFFNKRNRQAIVVFREIINTPKKDEIYRYSLTYLVNAFYNLKEYEKVIEEYERNAKAINSQDDFSDIYKIVSSSYQELFRFKEAASILDKLLSRTELDQEYRDEVFFQKANILLSSKDYQAAIKIVEEYFKENINNSPEALFITAEAYYELGKFGIAYNHYREIEDKFSDSKFSDESLYSLAYCWLSMKKDEEARKSFFKYFQQGKNNEKRQDALYNVIIIEKKHKLIKRAIEHSEEYLREFSEGKVREDILFQLGVFYSDLDQRKKAIELFIQFINLRDKSLKLPEAYFLLAYNLQLIEEYDRALKYYKRAVSSSNSGRDILYLSLKNSAFIYLKKGKEKKTVQIFQKIIDDFKERDIGVETYFWLIQYYLDAEEFQEALEISEKIDKKAEISQHLAEISYLKGEINRGLGNYQKAIEYYDLVLAGPDKNKRFVPASRIGKGLCLKAVKQDNKAKREFELAITESPNDHTIAMRSRYEIAGIECLQGNKSKAAKLYMLIAVLYDDQKYVPLALNNAGKIFAELNQKEKALYAYQEILKDYPENQMAEIAKAQLEKINAD